VLGSKEGLVGRRERRRARNDVCKGISCSTVRFGAHDGVMMALGIGTYIERYPFLELWQRHIGFKRQTMNYRVHSQSSFHINIPPTVHDIWIELTLPISQGQTPITPINIIDKYKIHIRHPCYLCKVPCRH